MDPIPNPSREIDKIKKFFLAYHRTKPKVIKKKPIDLAYLFHTSKVFRFAPLVNYDYIS